MKKEIVYTDDYLLVVDDSEIKDFYYDKYSKKVHESGGAEYSRNDITKNIIAYLPINHQDFLEGVPLLPPLEQEEDVERLAEEEYPIIPNTSPNVNWDRANKQEGFERGYNKAREKYKFTEKQIDVAIDWAIKKGREGDVTITDIDNLIQSLSQPKKPTHFEFEMENKFAMDGHTIIGTELKTTTNSQGQVELVGKYI